MFTTRFSQMMSAAMIVGTLTMVSIPTAFAATSTERAGYSPASAAAPDSATHELQPGQWDWYEFQSQPNDVVSGTGDNPNQNATMNVTMNIMNGQGNFEVWNQQNLQDWLNSVKVTPVGEGTENKEIHSDPLHYWAGNFSAHETFYLIVQNNGSTPMDYSLNVNSQDVNFPTTLHIAAMQ